jgi:hypothetical protein
MKIKIINIDLRVLNMRTRMPFKYGITTLTALPHLFVHVTADVNGRTSTGVASDGLAPKWFTKNPKTTVRNDLEEMIDVIRHAAALASGEGECASMFDLWKKLTAKQSRYGQSKNYPPLLWNFGVSLVERAAIDAICRATGRPFHQALRENIFGIRLGEVYDELSGLEPKDLLPAEPVESVIARHTVGLADPLTDAEIPPAERVDDGLPQSLEAATRTYGLTHYKIKLIGDPAKDIPRLKAIAQIVTGDYAFTLDGNENFHEVETFRRLWETLAGDASLKDFLSHLLFVEQPFHRDIALSDDLQRTLPTWTTRPPMIIDESDGAVGDLPRALDCGYAGTSHKNCKGVLKGIANRCLIEKRNRDNPTAGHVMSDEDLASVGPVAMLQDLAVASAMGMTHAERNGHHYFRGLSMYPADIQQQVLAAHDGLYVAHRDGYPTLNIRNGQLAVGSINRAMFGYGFDLDPSRFEPLAEWKFESLGLG